MTKSSIYPTRRQKAFFESYDVNIKQFHVVTSGSIMYFRYLFRLIILMYAVFSIISGFELLSAVMVTDLDVQSKIVAPSLAGLMLVLTVAMGLIHNQILLILGHGYKSNDAQLYVDRLTTNEECRASLTIIKSMYFIAIVIPLVLLWFLWGMYGTPFYDGQFLYQIKAAGSVFGTVFNGSVSSSINSLFRPYLFVGSFALLSCLSMALLGLIQVTIAKARV